MRIGFLAFFKEAAYIAWLGAALSIFGASMPWRGILSFLASSVLLLRTF